MDDRRAEIDQRGHHLKRPRTRILISCLAAAAQQKTAGRKTPSGLGDLRSVPYRGPHSENGAQEGTRTLTPYGTRPSNVCVYQFHHLSDSKTEERRLSEIGSRV